MLFTRKQIETISAQFAQNPCLNYVAIVDSPNGSGIGPNTDAKFYSIFDALRPEADYIVDITDVSIW